MKKTSKLILSFLVLLFIIIFGVGQFFYLTIYGIPTRNETVNLEYQMSRNWVDTVFMNSANYERVKITSDFDYELDGLFFRTDSLSEKSVIVCHGVGAHKYAMFKVVPMFLELGFNVFVYDTRGHGESGGENYSFGYFEKYDLETVVNFLHKNYNTECLGVYGESMGAASILQHIELNQQDTKVDFYISDCAYSDLKAQFAYRLKQDYGLPDIGIVSIASFVTRIHEGYYFSEIIPIKWVSETNTPIMFIHGKEDDYVPFFMGEKLHNAKPMNKHFYWVNHAKHVESYSKDPQNYKLEIQEFLNTFLCK